MTPEIHLFGIPLCPTCGLLRKVMLIVSSVCLYIAKKVWSLISWCQLQLLKCVVSCVTVSLRVDSRPISSNPFDLDSHFNLHLNGWLLCCHLAYHFYSYQRTETQMIYMNNKSCLKLIMWYSKATFVPSVNDSKATSVPSVNDSVATPVPSVNDNWKHIARGITKMMDETSFLNADHIACHRPHLTMPHSGWNKEMNYHLI
jgi:hypothetical protein